MDRGSGSIRWSLFRDATCVEAGCVLSGSLPVDVVQHLRPESTQNSRDSASNSTSFSLDSTGIQLVPELQHRVWDLLEQKRRAMEEGSEGLMDVSGEAFPIAAETLTLGPRAAELGLDAKDELFCQLQLDNGKAETAGSPQDRDWFSWKLTRAAHYRSRGNEAFKRGNFATAAKLYKRALAWLEPPASRSDVTLDTKVQYSVEELQQVKPMAVACYANMATCYSKLDGDGDRCIAAATKALELDEAHVKARYRRSQAYVSAKEFDLALADLAKLRALEPDAKLFRTALTRAQTAKTQLRKKQQSAFASIFDQ